ncbi:hypothetical protein DIZ76_016975 [Coccidioides immitis]|nr:hypothetical protein DIZ76_016975 [Coccidioides immitis]
MSGFKGIIKDGWHPKGRDGGRESWRGDFKGINQVAGWVGKGKDPNASQRTEHVARPLSSLKDPSSFAPPPKRSNTGNGASYTPPPVPSRRQAEQETSMKPAPPPVPHRASTTGLSTNRFPTPPVRQGGDGTATKSKPYLPPRLPPREALPTTASSPPPPPYEAVQRATEPYLSQGATSRLAKAGVSVPELGIQRQGNNTSSSQSPNYASTAINATNELQSRFSRLNTSSSSPVSSTPAATHSPVQGVTPQQFQTAATAASHIASQPAVQQTIRSNVSPGLHPAPPGRTNSFRDRHEDQIQSVKGKLNGLNQKYGITKRINDFIEDQKSPAYPDAPPPPPGHPSSQPAIPNHPYSSPNTSRPDLDALNKRKPPPPPPPKKASMHSKPVNHSPSPPPLPLNTKPR